jgi:hypothetical protein
MPRYQPRLVVALLIIGFVAVAIGIYAYIKPPDAPVITTEGKADSLATTPTTQPAKPKIIWEGDVDPRKPWQSIGVKVSGGDYIYAIASGSVTWAHDVDPVNQTVGPMGTSYKASDLPPPNPNTHDYQFPYADAGCGSLVMKVGTRIYPVGSAGNYSIIDDGFIEFMVNDRYGFLSDNTGGFHVIVQKR